MAARGRALIVAVHEFDHESVRDLHSPAADAQELKRVLEDPAIGGLEVEVVLNEVEWRVKRKVDQFFRQAKPAEFLLLHIASHGLKNDSGGLFFAAKDTDKDALESTAIEAEWLTDRMKASPSRAKVVLLDCCYSGAFAKGARGGEHVDVIERFEEGKGVAVLTASNATQSAFDAPDATAETPATSIFTTALVEGLETGEADLDGDGEISVDDLYQYVYKHVTEHTSKQTPSISQWGLEGQLKIAKSVRRQPGKTRLATSSRDYSRLEPIFALPLEDEAGDAQEVYALAISPDGRTVVAGTNECVLAWKGNREIQHWDPAALPEPERLQEHGNFVYSVAFSRDGTMVAAGGEDAVPQVTDVATGETRRLVLEGEDHSEAVYCVDFKSDGSRLASGGWDRKVLLWEPASGAFVRSIPRLGARVSSVAFGSRTSENVLAIGMLDNRILLVDVASGRDVDEIPAHGSSVEAVAFSPNGELLASCGLDKLVRVWDLAQKRARWANDSEHEYLVRAVAFAPNGNTIASASWDKKIRSWDVAREDPRALSPAQRWALHTDWIWAIAFSPLDGAVFVSGGSDGKIVVWAFPTS